jgi:hypothetical protein
VKGIASAAHIYNKPAVEAESFTSIYVWQEGPTELKPLADRAFGEGLNRIIYHTFPHTPPEAGSPGWVYNFGTLIHTNNSWWPKSKAWHYYLSRNSYLLQQGNFVGDVAYYYGDQAPNFVKYKQVQPGLGFGFDYDMVNSDVILNRMSVKNGKIVLPHGQTYEVLALPADDRVTLPVLQKLEAMVKAGATLVGRKPTRTYGLHNYAAQEAQIRQLADRLWGRCDSVTVHENRYGAGRVVWGKPLKQVLAERKIGPDVQLNSPLDSADIDYIHRRTATDDLYFVRNTRRVGYEAELTFRTAGRTPQLWNAAEGSIASLPVVHQDAATTTVRVRLDPQDAFFVVFREKPRPHPISLKAVAVSSEKSLAGTWQVRFPHGWDAPARVDWPTLHDWTTDDNEAIRHFSGIAAYHTTVSLTPADLPNGKRYVLDFGDVREVADLWVNGQHLGERVVPPYRYDVTNVLKPGANYLIVEVANVLNNRLVGDAKRPPTQRRTKTNLDKGPQPWLKPWAEVALRPSGLLGPIRLMTH